MAVHAETVCSAFEGFRLIASGKLAQVVAKTKKVIDRGERAPILIFDNATGEQVEVDFRGSVSDVLKTLAEPTNDDDLEEGLMDAPPAASSGPGRPRLGVVAHEVTLLPQHWVWLRRQPGGASVALRKLVSEARCANEGKDRLRAAQEASYRFMSAIAGNLKGFEEVTRALFAGDAARFCELTEGWSRDIRDHARKMAAMAFSA